MLIVVPSARVGPPLASCNSPCFARACSPTTSVSHKNRPDAIQEDRNSSFWWRYFFLVRGAIVFCELGQITVQVLQDSDFRLSAWSIYIGIQIPGSSGCEERRVSEDCLSPDFQRQMSIKAVERPAGQTLNKD